MIVAIPSPIGKIDLILSFKSSLLKKSLIDGLFSSSGVLLSSPGFVEGLLSVLSSSGVSVLSTNYGSDSSVLDYTKLLFAR